MPLDALRGCIYNVYMTTKLKMWGNSLGVHIPKHVSDGLGLRAGSDVQVLLQGKVVTIKPAQKQQETLRELVKGITKENRHEETYLGYPVGKEIW